MRRFSTTFGILAIAAFLVVRLGIYNIAATEPHWRITYEILKTVRTWSVAAHSRSIMSPSLYSEKMEQEGAQYYHHTCRQCHGAPQRARSEFAKGLYPVPPGLTSETEDLQDAELFWVVKNGIKMTGMPSFGITRRDEDLWSLVAFLKRYPKLTPKEYEAITICDDSDELE